MARLKRLGRFFYEPLGVDLFCLGKKFLIFHLIHRNLTVKYRRSVFGLLWTLLTPLSTTLVYYFVFKVIMNQGVPNHLIFFLTGVLTWNFVNQSIIESMETIVNNAGLLTKVPVSLQTFSFSGTLTNFVTYLLALPILIASALFSQIHLGHSLLVMPFYLLNLFLITYALGFILSIFYIRFRDLRHLMSIGLQLWMWTTPVLYEASMIPEKYHLLLPLNPFGYLFADLHDIWLRNLLPAWPHGLQIACWSVSLTFLSAWIHRHYAPGLLEQI